MTRLAAQELEENDLGAERWGRDVLVDLLPWVEGVEILEWEAIPAEAVCGGSCLYSGWGEAWMDGVA